MGSYSNFDLGLPIQSETAFAVPTVPGVTLHDILTVWLNGSGSIDSVVDGIGPAVTSTNAGPADITTYP
jgi:hypothetical protein